MHFEASSFEVSKASRIGGALSSLGMNILHTPSPGTSGPRFFLFF